MPPAYLVAYQRAAARFGLGLGVLHLADRGVFLSSTTPIDEENVKVRWVFSARKADGADAAENLANGLTSGVSQDLPIWENKRYRERPILCEGDGPIMQYRKWAAQFYALR